MKNVGAIIKPFASDKVKAAQGRASVARKTVSEATGLPRQRRGGEYVVDFQPRAGIEVVLADHQVEAAADQIAVGLKVGNFSDVKVFVSLADEAIHARTLETGESAVW